MQTQLLSIGILVIILGFIIVVVGSLLSSGKSDTKFAVGGFIGFIPFGFGNDKNMLWVVLALSAIIFVFSIIFQLYLRNN